MELHEYALMWANGATFAEVYAQMKADIETELYEPFQPQSDSEES